VKEKDGMKVVAPNERPLEQRDERWMVGLGCGKDKEKRKGKEKG
jgi:hypothetical protein